MGSPVEQPEAPMVGHEEIDDIVVVGTGSLESLDVPSIGEHDLVARDDCGHESDLAVCVDTELPVDDRQESGTHELGMSRPRTEVPRTGDHVATLDPDALAVGSELAAHGDPRTRSEGLGEPGVGQVGGNGSRGGKVGDADPAERSVEPGHALPQVEQLAEARLGTACGTRIGEGHQPGRPHRIDHLVGERATLLDDLGLIEHESLEFVGEHG